MYDCKWDEVNGILEVKYTYKPIIPINHIKIDWTVGGDKFSMRNYLYHLDAYEYNDIINAAMEIYEMDKK